MKKWQKNTLMIVGTIIIVYLMVYIRVRTEASKEFNEAEKYYHYAQNPEDKKKDMLAFIEKRGTKLKMPDEKTVKDEKEYMIQLLRDRDKPKEETYTIDKTIEKFAKGLHEYYLWYPVDIRNLVDDLLNNQKLITQNEKEWLIRELSKVDDDIEKFAREIKEYYYNHPDTAKKDLDDLLAKHFVKQGEYEWLIGELTDIKEIFESDIKTAYYGYKTVLDIWLDPPGWPRSILRNIKLADEARVRLKEVEPKFNTWVNEVAPTSPTSQIAPKPTKSNKPSK